MERKVDIMRKKYEVPQGKLSIQIGETINLGYPPKKNIVKIM